MTTTEIEGLRFFFPEACNDRWLIRTIQMTGIPS
jgi:hypothetical protein